MLSSKGSAKFSFVITFLIIFLVCGVYCFLELDKKTPKKSSTVSYETKLRNATENYVNDYYKDLNAGERLIIRLSTLKNLNYIELDNCSGYSIVDKDSKLQIDSYLKCSDYESDDYNKEYE